MAAPKGHPPYNKNGEGGRPKKWDGKSLDELAESLDKWIEKAIEKRDQFWWWDWCFDVGLNQSKVAVFAKEHLRFRRSYEAARDWQESIVARHALTKKFSEGFSKFMLVNHYNNNWKEKGVDERDKTPPQDAIIDKDNENMALKATIARLNKELDQLQAKIENKPQAGSELP
jgi:hypothetical protein